jgi:CheY-like chemotaxis protein
MADVLIVDDDEAIRAALRLVLTRAGHAAAEAEDGVAALDYLCTTPLAMVVILDVVMPKLGGLGVLNAVAADPQLATRHAYLLMTAHPRVPRPPAIDELLSSLAVPVLQKPFDMHLLLETVTRAAARLGAQASAVETSAYLP